jgi:MerR family transcriptional regulator, repressor of the yfmOP operon
MRIGEVAEAVGTTSRTIRYYEEIGLLGSAADRASGKHRTYTEADVERLRELLRLKHMLGLTLEELKAVMHGEDARAQRRREWHETDAPAERRRILTEGTAHVDALLELVRRRRADLESFEAELNERRQKQTHLLRELGERV